MEFFLIKIKNQFPQLLKNIELVKSENSCKKKERKDYISKNFDWEIISKKYIDLLKKNSFKNYEQ